MLPTCKQVSEQSSENIDEPIRGFKWFKMKLHLLICIYCRRYQKQIELSSQTVKVMDEKVDVNQDVKNNVESAYKELHGNKNTQL
jgi:hypothetical protein